MKLALPIAGDLKLIGEEPDTVFVGEAVVPVTVVLVNEEEAEPGPGNTEFVDSVLPTLSVWNAEDADTFE